MNNQSQCEGHKMTGYILNLKYVAYHALVACLFMLCGITQATAKDVIMDGVNWSRGMITAEGWGAPPERYRDNPARGRIMACRAAIVDAQRNLLERTKGVRIDSTTLVKDTMAQSDLVKTAVRGIIKGVHPRSRTLMDDGSCKVEAELPISGDLFSSLVPRDQFQKNIRSTSLEGSAKHHHPLSLLTLIRELMITDAQADEHPNLIIQTDDQQKLIETILHILDSNGSQTAKAQLQQALDDYQRIAGFSGIIIDASHIPNFRPAMTPWLRDSSGHKLYPNLETSYDLIQKKLPVTYDFSIDDAMHNERVAHKPMIIRAESIYGKRASDLVLDGKSLRRFRTVMDENHLGEKARIMIVLSE